MPDAGNADMTGRIEALGEAAAERAAARLAAKLDEVPGVAAEVSGGRIQVSGRGLWRRPALRWIGGMLR
jgi:hypothetical protein